MRVRFAVNSVVAIVPLVAVACTAASGEGAPPPKIAPQTGAPSSAALEAGRAVNAFSFELWKQAPREVDAALSPFGVASALAMAYAGARGETAAEMAKVTGFKQDAAAHGTTWREFLAATAGTEAKGGVTLTVANALWMQKDTSILPAFRASLVADHGAAPTTVDFAGAPGEAVAAINAWTSDRTGGMIRALLHESDVDPLTRLVLTNAVYFKGLWMDEFDRSLTKPAEFRAPGGKRSVPTMRRSIDCGYARLPGLKVLELRYKGGDASMILVLPDADDGLAALEAKLTAEQFDAWLGKLEDHDVEVKLPRFKVSSRLPLARSLAALGMPTAVSASADFSGIDGARGLFLGSAVHEAVVVVDEKGTEAAAATGLMFPTSRMERDPPSFVADHPFLFLVRDRRTGAVLFIGRVVEPKP